ncbi:hypothetical protein L7F22_066364 [Adiantum nelumboides]|nr:hypothetical protein [Adiantum nelumboides]
MAISFSTFYGRHDENARDFMDSLEMAHLMAGHDQEEVKLQDFPLVLKGEARVWYDSLAPPSKATWPTFYGAFLNKYGHGDTPENLWKQLLRHRQGSLGDYTTYESKFTNLWERWTASLQGQGGAPKFLKRDKFVEVVVIPKKNGKWRVCVDYKPLNAAATKRDHFPLPFQDEILNEVAGHECYTICDGYSGYYQIRIAKEDQHKTTFITPWGCFAFRVMPFGLTNAPSTFTRLMNFIFQPFFGKSIRVFLDDFCTYSDRALHCQRVEEGLQRLYQYGGELNPDKCHVAEKEVVLLGHVISQEGIKVDPSRVQAILDLPPPNSVGQVITFVQKVRYMSRFIHFLSQIISPLQQLANQEVFSWEQEHLECFNEAKEVLGSLPTIMLLDPQGTYYLCPSVGLDAFGAVLMQKDPKIAYMRPIYFTSKVMTQEQKGYTNIEQLVFSLIVATRKFRSYLLPKPFIILTLEHNLPYAIQHMSISSKISKWVLELQEYEYTFIVEDNTRANLADVLTYKENDILVYYFELMHDPPALLYAIRMEEAELPRFYLALYPPHREPPDQLTYIQIVEQIGDWWEKGEGLWKEWITVMNGIQSWHACLETPYVGSSKAH